ncbi:MAG TPA: saccharopine dehydrogenase C-terminal domain-containing protein [Allosphingosinicella sp.]|nr:saccharopine dehydrogenase C-terminal domain-containing protein [Allosphingosinicella sp.]
MKEVLLVGGGRIGAMITDLLATSGDYHVTVADHSAEALAGVREHARVATLRLDVTDRAALLGALSGKFAVLSAVPFAFTIHVARGAAEAGVHYFDLTEDVATTNQVRELASGSRGVMMPQCGLAPGFVSIVAYDLANRFDALDEVRMRVGALTEHPANRLRYELTWSVEGLIHEYLAECDAIVDGKPCKVQPLEGHESFTLDGIDYEAFNTSGGIGTLGATLAGRVRNLNYKTIRYPGHCEIMKRLIRGLRLDEATLTEIFGYALPRATQDVVIILVSATGRNGGEPARETFVRKVHSRAEAGLEWSAIQITTASAICAVLDLVRDETLPQQGFLRQEDVALEDFLANRFGQVFA